MKYSNHCFNCLAETTANHFRFHGSPGSKPTLRSSVSFHRTCRRNGAKACSTTSSGTVPNTARTISRSVMPPFLTFILPGGPSLLAFSLSLTSTDKTPRTLVSLWRICSSSLAFIFSITAPCAGYPRVAPKPFIRSRLCIYRPRSGATLYPCPSTLSPVKSAFSSSSRKHMWSIECPGVKIARIVAPGTLKICPSSIAFWSRSGSALYTCLARDGLCEIKSGTPPVWSPCQCVRRM